MPESAAGFSIADLVSLAGLVVIIGGAIVGIPIWINRMNSSTKKELYDALSSHKKDHLINKDEIYKVLTKNRTECTETKEKVAILEVKQEALSNKVGVISDDVRTVKDTLNQMQLDNQANHLSILTAIAGRHPDG